MTKRSGVLAAGLALVLTSPARGMDEVIEINDCPPGFFGAPTDDGSAPICFPLFDPIPPAPDDDFSDEAVPHGKGGKGRPKRPKENREALERRRRAALAAYRAKQCAACAKEAKTCQQRAQAARKVAYDNAIAHARNSCNYHDANDQIGKGMTVWGRPIWEFNASEDPFVTGEGGAWDRPDNWKMPLGKLTCVDSWAKDHPGMKYNVGAGGTWSASFEYGPANVGLQGSQQYSVEYSWDGTRGFNTVSEGIGLAYSAKCTQAQIACQASYCDIE